MKANRKLLQDVLNEAADPIREEVLEASLRELRRRRQMRRIQKTLPLAIAAVLVLGFGFFYFALDPQVRNATRAQHESAPPGPVSGYPPIEVVTNHWAPFEVVESRQYQSLIVNNAMVQQPIELLDDAALLGQFPDKPVGLMADGNGVVQLVFLDPRDQALLH